MRLIDADNLKKDLNVEFIFDSRDRYRVRDLIDIQTTIDAEPVRRGRWLEDKCFECSECKAHAAFAILSDGKGGRVPLELLSNYCPNCGARMEGMEGEE